MTDRYAKHWTWEFDAKPMAVWTVLADTARFNEAACFPKHEISERKDPDGGVSYIGTAKISGFTSLGAIFRWNGSKVSASLIATSFSERQSKASR